MDLVEIRKKAKGRKNRKPAKGEKESGTAAKRKRKTEQAASPDLPPAPTESEPGKEVAMDTAPDEMPVEEPEHKPDPSAETPAPIEVRDGDGFSSLKDVFLSQHEEVKDEEEEEQLQLLTFMLSGEEYALNIMDIKEIVRTKEPTEVPKTPDFVEGIISLRGTIIPIYDVNRRLGLAPTERDQKNRVIVVKFQEHLYGLLVDSVVQVMNVPLSRIEPPPEILGGVEGEFLRGVGKIEDRLIILLNLSRVLAMDHGAAGADAGLPSEAAQET